MSKRLNAALAALIFASPALADGVLGLGRPALPEEIAAWDVDVLPDGRGLPEGSGDVFTGEEVFAEKCAACHGDFAEGVDNWPVLAGGFDTLGDKDPVKTVGSYWPYLSTLWDYVHRSMPFGEAGTLSADETYAIVAYILYSNDLVDDEFELSHENFAAFGMYNADGFVVDDRPEQEYAKWRGKPCMANCKDAVEITMRSVFLVETPPEGGTNSVMNHATMEGLPRFTAAGSEPEHLTLKGDPEYGEYLSGECTTCHQASGENDGIPSIVHWPESDFVNAMHAYKSKKRAHPVMQMMAERLNAEEIAALAAYFATVDK